jgi:glyoxylase-like metal-dependent hydrolase (beta-lactamase superfamily II)
MRIVTVALCLCLCLIISLQPRAVSAQAAASSVKPQAEDQRARRVLDNALRSLGGIERLRALTSILLRAKGVERRSAEVQGYQPDGATNAEHEETLVVFPSQARLSYEHRTGRHDGTVRWRRWMLSGSERVVADLVVNAVYPARGASVAQQRVRLARRIPHLLLLEAANNLAHLRWLGEQTYEGRKHEVVEFRLTDEKQPLRLFFDAATHLLTKYDYLMDFPLLGDTRVEYAFRTYRQDKQLGWFPSGDTIRVAGNVYREVSYTEVAADAPRAEESFRLPDHLAALLTPPGTVLKIAEGMYLVEIGSNFPMFIEFNDFVMAIEAPAPFFSLDHTPADSQPGSSSLSEALIQKIKETIPNKPIRYLVVTHFHTDHAGGARAFLAEGATILTTPGNKGPFERMAAAPFTVVPDRYSSTGGKLRLETFEQKRVVTDGQRTVELINVGANPHTSENIIVYAPQEKILYQGDLFYFDGDAHFPPKDRMTVMPFFAKWLRDNRLSPARIYGFHTRGFATMKHVEQILNLSRT